MKAVFKFMAVLMVVLMTLSFVACGTQTTQSNSTAANETSAATTKAATTAENVKLKIYAQYTEEVERKILDYAMAEMKKIMPNVVLEVDIAPQDNGVKFKSYLATGSLPDITTLDMSTLPIALKSKSIVMLDDYVKKAGIADQMTEAGKATLNQIDGHTYYVPSTQTYNFFIYANKTVFEQAGVKIPENYEEFLATVKALKAKNITPLSIFLKESWPAELTFLMAALPENPNLGKDLDINGTAKASDASYLNGARKIVELSKAGLVSKDAYSMSYDQAIAVFANGESAMFVNGSWDVKNVGDKLGDKVCLLSPYAFADASKVQAAKDVGAVVGFGRPSGYGISSNSKYTDIAAEYGCQLALKVVEARIKDSETNSYLAMDITPDQPFNSLQMEMQALIKNSKYATDLFADSKISTDVATESQKLFTGQYEAEDFAKSLDALLENDRKQQK